MSPSILLQRDSYPEPYPEAPLTHMKMKSPPKGPAVEGGISLDSHAPVGGTFPIHHSSFHGNGHQNGSDRPAGNLSFSGARGDGTDFVSSQTLLQQSLNYAAGGSDGAPKKPNILYIMADQMAAPLLKMNDPNSPIKTPNIDALANAGVVFSSAYCNSPLCAPSRFTMCTGQLPSKIGGYDNAAVLGPEVPTYAHYLRREGYETALAGKMHFIGPDQLHGFEHR